MYRLGAAAVALFAATGSGHAADVMPIVVPVTTPATPVVTGPTVTIQTETLLYIGSYGSYFLETGLAFDGEVNVVSASGWGFNLLSDGALGVGREGNDPPYLNYGADFRAELYRIVGNAEIGFFVAPYGFNPVNLDLGPTFRYTTDRVEFRHETEISVYSPDWWVELQNELTVHVSDRLDIDGYFDLEFGAFGRYLDLGVGAEMKVNDRLTVHAWGNVDVVFGAPIYFELNLGGAAELDVNDRLTVEGWASIDLFGGFGVGLGGEARLHLGPISPFVMADWYSNGGLWVGAGLELEHPIGTGPFTLIGDAGVGLAIGGSPNYYASIGIRFNRGNVANLMHTHNDGS